MNTQEIKALDAVVNWVLREEPEEASSEHIYKHAQTLKTFLAMKSMTKDERLSRMCDLLFEANKETILRDGDWWFGTDHYDINFFDWHDEPSFLEVVVYDITGKYHEYSQESTVFRKHIYIGEKA